MELFYLGKSMCTNEGNTLMTERVNILSHFFSHKEGRCTIIVSRNLDLDELKVKVEAGV